VKFLNKKEQVLDTLLTPHGEKLLADGRFKPEYYAFFDDNILYEPQYAAQNHADKQNDVEPRIQEDTPQLETQVVFSDRNTWSSRSTNFDKVTVVDTDAVGFSDAAGLTLGDGSGVSGAQPNPDPPNNPGVSQTVENLYDLSKSYSLFERHFYGPQYALGTTDKFSTTSPAWSVSLLRGEIATSTDVAEGATRPTLDIPQLDVALTFNIDVISDQDFVSDTELAVTFPNGEILDIEPQILLAQIKESNVEFTKDNFEIQVYEVTTENVVGAEASMVEVLRPLKFRRAPALVQNDILLDPQEITYFEGPLTPDNVEYYFDIRTDAQISDRLICSSIEQSRKEGRYVDIDFECEDTTDIALVDIYSTNASSGPCPDLSDPCDDESGTVY